MVRSSRKLVETSSMEGTKLRRAKGPSGSRSETSKYTIMVGDPGTEDSRYSVNLGVRWREAKNARERESWNEIKSKIKAKNRRVVNRTLPSPPLLPSKPQSVVRSMTAWFSSFGFLMLGLMSGLTSNSAAVEALCGFVRTIRSRCGQRFSS